MNSAQVLTIAAQRGHRCQSDPPHDLSSVQRWTCPCGRAALLNRGTGYGSALTEDCDVRERAAAALLAAEARHHGVASISALHDEIDANEAIAAALEAVGLDALDHDAANAVTARADELLR